MGIIIFIWIIFTSVNPLILVMKQTDNRYSQKVYEMRYRNRDKIDEALYINTFHAQLYNWPICEFSDIYLKFKLISMNMFCTIKRLYHQVGVNMIYKKRRGVSTILGVVIFIGILFTAVIPMQLVMQQADYMLERKKLEMGVKDDERSKETLQVVAYPNTSNSSEMYVRIENKGEVAAKIVRIWFNDDYQTNDTVVSTKDNVNMGPFPVSPNNNSFNTIFVVTERGNTFSSLTGSLYYSDGTWYTTQLSITVFILNDQGQYKISVKNATQQQVGYWDSGGIIHGDVVQSFEVEEAGTYTVIMEKKHSGEFKELVASPCIVQITWPEGPPLVYVYGDGNDLK